MSLISITNKNVKNIKDKLLLSLLQDYCKKNNINYSFVLLELKKNININDNNFTQEYADKFLNLLKNFSKCDNIVHNQFIYKNKIGSGTFGNVYMVNNILDQKDYAIKKINYTNDNIFNECRILSKLNHKNIIRYNSVWHDSIYLYLQMELCSKTLKEHCLQRTKITKIDIKYFLDSLEGLYYLHSNNIIHRDIKSSNILIKNKTAKISDFNISKEIKNNSNKIIIVKSSGAGTELYSSPEIINNENYDYRTDIYSMGIVYFEIITKYKDNFDRIINIQKVKEGLHNLDNIKNIDRNIIIKMLKNNYKNRPNTKKLIKLFQKRFIKFNPHIIE